MCVRGVERAEGSASSKLMISEGAQARSWRVRRKKEVGDEDGREKRVKEIWEELSVLGAVLVLP